MNKFKNQKIIWEPFPGAQKKFLSCPAWECLMSGNRGGGKTDALLMDYLREVGVGHGAEWRGLLLREATTELGDVIAKSKKWIPQIFPGAKYNNSRKIWTFESGESLWFNYARTEEDYWQYHGQEFPWIGWEELTNQIFPDAYLKLMSCNRSSNKGIVPRYRSTCNPAGPGHAWVKQRFIDVAPPCKIFTDKHGQTRTYVQSILEENRALLDADPTYLAKLMAMTEGNSMLRKAWIDGSWDLMIGGYFTDVWNPDIHVLEPFKFPKSWHVIRSFDWGSSRPWAVTCIAECNGEQPDGYPVYFPRGSCVIIDEIYGWTGEANKGDGATSQQIADRVLFKDKEILETYGVKVYAGPADTSIWEVRDGTSIAANMAINNLYWTKAYKGSGSRIAGWSIIRSMLFAAKEKDLEKPGLYFFNPARNHIRTLPMMQRDKAKPEDIDSDLEDHAMDSMRYGLARKAIRMRRRKVSF